MSADASIKLEWAGDEYVFRLAIGQLRELQENVNRWRVAIGASTIGPRTLLRLLAEGDAWPDEVREIIRLGLIGGKVKIDRVPALIKRYVDERPLLESTKVAQMILWAAMVGPVDDPVGQKKTPEETDESLTSQSGSQTSMDRVAH